MYFLSNHKGWQENYLKSLLIEQINQREHSHSFALLQSCESLFLRLWPELWHSLFHNYSVFQFYNLNTRKNYPYSIGNALKMPKYLKRSYIVYYPTP